jgi:Zn-dependent peptidase ImmA (M78 family)
MNKSLNKLGLSRVYEEMPIQVGKICSALDIKASQIDLPEDISGLIRLDNNHCYIEINKEHHPHRKRFTIAHELGHYCLHHDLLKIEKKILERSDKIFTKDDIVKEKEADDFAAELLMPEDIFIQKSKELTPNELSEYFFVSISAIHTRLKNLLVNNGY